MLKIIAAIGKELLLLQRDKTGLLLLFLMPAVLVVALTLVQENILKAFGEGQIKGILVDLDGSELGKRVGNRLGESAKLTIVQGGAAANGEEAVQAVARGEYQFCVILPEGITSVIRQRARSLARKSLGMEQAGATDMPAMPEVSICFDAMVRGGFRSAVRAGLDLLFLSLEVEEKGTAYGELLPNFIKAEIRREMGPYAAMNMGELPDIAFQWNKEPLLKIRQQTGGRNGIVKDPSAVQHNVPAWALFGIFFIVVPMAGSLLKERQNGTFRRLLTMPVSPLPLLFGKMAAYALVCLLQFCFIFLLGMYVLPLLGADRLELGQAPAALFLMVAVSILAATGYGILLGTMARTYEQASMFGALSVVIAAVLGGIMVPVYAMPAIMQKISVVSPLCWGLNGFVEVFVRGGTLATVWPWALALFLFFFISIGIACLNFARRFRLSI